MPVYVQCVSIVDAATEAGLTTLLDAITEAAVRFPSPFVLF